MTKTVLRVGMDDTDSPSGMCTTYLGFRAVQRLKKRGAKFLSYPRLVRFNPNIPWKTRGNGAVGLEFSTDDADGDIECVTRMVEKYADVKNGANPGAVFCTGAVPSQLRKLGDAAMWRLVGRADAKKTVQSTDVKSFNIGNGQGLVGAAAVIGYDFGRDSTLEMLSYRRPSMFGRRRRIDGEQVRLMQQKTSPKTFSSYDQKRRRVMIAPRGPDPVLYGIRGESASALLAASSMIKPGEATAGYMIFRSNQGTGRHLEHDLDASSLAPYMSGTVSGLVHSPPKMLCGGHVFFDVLAPGGTVRCAVYKESGMAHLFMHLVPGDRIRVGGGVRPASKSRPRAINAEFVAVLYLQKVHEKTNPPCPSCRKNMKSKGANQGFECVRCKRRAASKLDRIAERGIRTGTYLPDASSQRHLSRPAQRQKFHNVPQFRGSSRWFCAF